jgi:rod shape determining protein RodA
MVGLAAAIAGFGLLVLYSASYGHAEGGGVSSKFTRQLLHLGIAAALAIAVSFLDLRRVQRFAPLAWAGILALLVLTLLQGQIRMGAERWLQVGPFQLQASEFAKLVVVLQVAHWLEVHPSATGYTVWRLRTPIVLVGAYMACVFLQPDLGTTLFYAFISGSMFFYAGLKWRSILLIGALAAIAAPVAYEVALDDYQRDRIRTFLNPEWDPKGKGYQTLQARYAIGSGQFLGQGWMAGTQSRGGFLPEQHTDFIFAVIGEEFGFAGTSLLVFADLFLLWTGLTVATRARDRFSHLVGIGVVAMLFWQMAINLGGVLGVLPVTGVPLPLVSYGGSALLGTGIALGLLWSVERTAIKAARG